MLGERYLLALVVLLESFPQSICFRPPEDIDDAGTLQLRNIIGRMNVLFSSNKNRASRECLMQKRKGVDGKASFRASYIFSVEGSDLRLSCDCLNQESQRWNRLDLIGDIAPVNHGKSDEFWVDGNTLVLKQVKSGISTYFCESIGRDELIGGIWTVEVVETEMFEKKTRKNRKKPKLFPSDEFQINNVNLIVRFLWSQFSQCSTCNTVGKRHRTGFCSIGAKSPDTSISPLNFYDSPISCSLFLELDPDFLNKLHINNEVLTDLRHSLGQKHQLVIGYCKVNCSEYSQPPLSRRILDLYKETLMNEDDRNQSDGDSISSKGLIWILKSLVNGVPVGRNYLPEVIAFLSLIALQIWICVAILRGYKSGQAQ